MGTHFRALFEQADGNIRRQLLQADRRGKARRACADDHDIVFHGFALDLFHSRFSVYW